jgi:sec-independent protein translocase protein TatB
MFEVGFTEIILILGLALLVLGPEKLPALAAKVGRWTGRARAMARQLRAQLEHEVTMEELAKSRPMQAPPGSTGDAGASTAAHTSQAAPEPDSSSTADPTGAEASSGETHTPTAETPAAKSPQ